MISVKVRVSCVSGAGLCMGHGLLVAYCKRSESSRRLREAYWLDKYHVGEDECRS